MRTKLKEVKAVLVQQELYINNIMGKMIISAAPVHALKYERNALCLCGSGKKVKNCPCKKETEYFYKKDEVDALSASEIDSREVNFGAIVRCRYGDEVFLSIVLDYKGQKFVKHNNRYLYLDEVKVQKIVKK